MSSQLAATPHRGPLQVTGAEVVPIPPPLYYGAALAAGLFLQKRVPLNIPARAITKPIGAVVLPAGLAFNVAAVITGAVHKTTIVPHHHVATLMTTGVYRVSRNPMYTGLAVATAGAGLVAGSWWPLILLPAALVAVRRLVIDPEERYLSQRFGPRYEDYRAKVPRWL